MDIVVECLAGEQVGEDVPATIRAAGTFVAIAADCDSSAFLADVGQASTVLCAAGDSWSQAALQAATAAANAVCLPYGFDQSGPSSILRAGFLITTDLSESSWVAVDSDVSLAATITTASEGGSSPTTFAALEAAASVALLAGVGDWTAVQSIIRGPARISGDPGESSSHTTLHAPSGVAVVTCLADGLTFTASPGSFSAGATIVTVAGESLESYQVGFTTAAIVVVCGGADVSCPSTVATITAAATVATLSGQGDYLFRSATIHAQAVVGAVVGSDFAADFPAAITAAARAFGINGAAEHIATNSSAIGRSSSFSFVNVTGDYDTAETYTGHVVGTP